MKYSGATKQSRVIIAAIEGAVHDMLADSKLVEGTMQERHEIFGIFQQDEIRLGKLLGRGGFSDVFELNEFRPSSKHDESFADHQVALRRFYRDTTALGKYVVKHLNDKSLTSLRRFGMSASDLVVESQYLCSLSHENVLKIRGWGANGVHGYANGARDGFFLILDRLCDTLDARMERWKLDRVAIDSLRKTGKNQHLKRVTSVVGQIGAALEYLHSKDIIFRDLKPNNVGFDQNGTVKIFDFGLARELPESCTNVNDVYEMSGVVGTARYMAPEVALHQAYNQKADTYSWAVLYWSCLTLGTPYASMNRATHTSLVCRLGERPKLTNDMPKSIQLLLKRAWAQHLSTRLTILEVCAHLERIEDELSRTVDPPITEIGGSKVSQQAFNGNKPIAHALLAAQ